jgi:class 3 adenylate cyclase
MLASMSEIDPRADTPLVNWSELGMTELLPTGTVTLDVEGSTRLWQTQADEMTTAVANLDRVLADVVAIHRGIRPVEQGEGDSFVIAFARASDAVACALELQRSPLAPIRLRIGVHTGEVQLRDEGNYIGPTINKTARLRDLAHGGQTVLSGATSELVIDQLPDAAFLTDLGSHPLRDLPRRERVVQLCHPDLRDDFPPLRTAKSVHTHKLPVQLTSFVGRAEQVDDVRQTLTDTRLVTLTGAGGVGKTRLAVEVAAQMTAEFSDGASSSCRRPRATPRIDCLDSRTAECPGGAPGRTANVRPTRRSGRMRTRTRRLAAPLQCPGSNAMANVAGPLIAVRGFHRAGPVRLALGIRCAITVRASASSSLARLAPRQ